MSQLTILSSRSNHAHEELVLVGFRIDGQHEGPQFYTLLAVGGEMSVPSLPTDASYSSRSRILQARPSRWTTV